MTWELLLPLIAKYGLPWVLDLLAIIFKHPQPTEDVVPLLRSLSNKSLDDYVKEAAAKLNLPVPTP